MRVMVRVLQSFPCALRLNPTSQTISPVSGTLLSIRVFQSFSSMATSSLSTAPKCLTLLIESSSPEHASQMDLARLTELLRP